jgi:membrane-bound serine protease (ClpP class)
MLVRQLRVSALFAALTAAFLMGFPGSGETSSRQIHIFQLEGIINPSAAEYLVEGLEWSNEEGAHLIVILLDTPGGLDPSMRDIVKVILNSKRPVVVYVSPRGGRAASAGTFLTMAAHVAAMAPGTNIGAAHPVGVGGEIPEEMNKKIENDAVAYLKSIAEARGRNAEWAEKAVRESASLTEKEAVAEGVVDMVAEDIETLLREINGRTVTTAAGEVVLETEGAEKLYLKMGLRRRILHTISNPNIAYILMMLGIVGIFFELTHPGVIFPGVVGALCLILGFYGLQTLPVNYAGLLLIVLSMILFIAEVKITSYGFLTIGGIVSLLLGSLMLIDSPVPFLRISLSVILATIFFTVVFFLLLVGAVVKVYRRRTVTGFEGLVGAGGECLTDLNPRGQIFVRGEIWEANCPGGIMKGEQVVVTKAEGLVLEVQPIKEEE